MSRPSSLLFLYSKQQRMHGQMEIIKWREPRATNLARRRRPHQRIPTTGIVLLLSTHRWLSGKTVSADAVGGACTSSSRGRPNGDAKASARAKCECVSRPVTIMHARARHRKKSRWPSAAIEEAWGSNRTSGARCKHAYQKRTKATSLTNQPNAPDYDYAVRSG